MNPHRKILTDATVAAYVALRALRRGDGCLNAVSALRFAYRELPLHREQLERAR